MTKKTISVLAKSFFVGLLIFFVINGLSNVSAKCVAIGAPLDEYAKSDAVFIGKVKAMDKGEDGFNSVHFLVIDGYKGVSATTASVIIPDSNFVSIGLDIKENEKYIVYATNNSEGKLSSSSCSRTKLYSEAKEDLEALAILSYRSGPIGDLLIISSDQKESDFYSIENIEIVNQDLVIEVSYGGGCEEHEFDLIWDGSFMKSKPPQVGFNLIHNSNDDLCKAIKYETLRFDIYPMIEKYIESYGDDSKILINIGQNKIEFNIPKYKEEAEMNFCTQEAKLCEDGITYVSRNSKNNCEFDSCPQIEKGTPKQKNILSNFINWFKNIF